MPPFAEDLSPLFDTSIFGTAATLQGGTTVNVVADKSYLENFGIAGNNPTCLARASDVSISNIGQTLTINATVYTIMNRKEVDDGAIVLLELRAP